MPQSPAFRICGRLATATTLVLDADPVFHMPYDEAVLMLDRDLDLVLKIETYAGGTATPFDDCERLTRSWVVARGPSELNVAALRADLAPGGRLHDLMGRLAEELDSRGATENADAVELELHFHFDEDDYSTGREVLEAERWFDGDLRVVTAEMDDDELEAIAEQCQESARDYGMVLVNVTEVLRRHRDALRDEVLEGC